MARTILFEGGGHKNVLLEDFTSGGLAVQANQHMIVDGAGGMILDPGGHKVYSKVLSASKDILGRAKLETIFLSHQDPDIVAAVNGWLMTTDATAYVSTLWVRFVPHFGLAHLVESRLLGIPDEGMKLKVGSSHVIVVPAHFLHSPGNFQIYDPVSKILHSGDLGASLGHGYDEVRDFDAHVPFMDGFHKRYMAGQGALRTWANTVRTLDVEIIAPQHGALSAASRWSRGSSPGARTSSAASISSATAMPSPADVRVPGEALGWPFSVGFLVAGLLTGSSAAAAWWAGEGPRGEGPTEPTTPAAQRVPPSPLAPAERAPIPLPDADARRDGGAAPPPEGRCRPLVVVFARSSSALPPGSDAAIDRVAALVAAHPDATVTLGRSRSRWRWMRATRRTTARAWPSWRTGSARRSACGRPRPCTTRGSCMTSARWGSRSTRSTGCTSRPTDASTPSGAPGSSGRSRLSAPSRT